jgi:sugar transferase (PEP-CTERM/EpsH1 system associated)
MKVLVITEQAPSRFNGGCARQLNLIRELSKRHDFCVVSYAYPVHMRELDSLRRYVRRVEVIPLPVPVMEERSRFYWQINAWRHALLDPYPVRGRYPLASEMRKRVARLVAEEQFDIIQVVQAYLAKHLPRTKAATILDMQDILSEHERLVMLAKTKVTHRFTAWLEWKKMLALERSAVRRFDMCVTMSKDDKSKFLELIPGTQVAVIANGVDIDYFQPQPAQTEEANLVFVGNIQYTPNADAVLYFYQEIWPLIRQKRPNLQFYVVGWGPPPEVRALDEDPNVTVTGFVDDVRPYLANGTVVVIPIRFGSGTRLKILDAWAMAKPIVSTLLGAEGLAVQHGENILLADEPEQFAQSVLSLLDDRQQRARLGQAGRQLVESKYSWTAIGAQMNEVYETILSNPH